MGDLVKYDSLNLIKWTLQTTNIAGITLESKNFTIQDRKCTFLFNSGYNGADRKPISFSIDFDDKQKFNPSVNVTVWISSSSETFPSVRLTITGEQKQTIWSTINFGVRGSLLTFEMLVLCGAILKDDKSVQTSSYIDTSILLANVSKDFCKLFQEGPDHDLEFICGDEIIRAHKNVLCSRSNVFASMLQSDMKEGKTGQVKILDLDSHIFREFLRCLYTGVLSNLTVDTALDFYEAADKYAVDALKKQCADFLMDNVSPENVCEILLMADRHSDPDLKKKVIEYIIKVEVPIVEEKWADFCKESPILANEVLNLYCRHLRQKKD